MMQYYETNKCPENRIVKGAVIKQLQGVYMAPYYCVYELSETLPSGRIVGVIFNHCRELKGRDGNTFYHPYDVREVLIDFGTFGKRVVSGSDLCIADGQLVSLSCARQLGRTLP